VSDVMKDSATAAQVGGYSDGLTGGMARDMIVRQPTAQDHNPAKYNRRRRIIELSLGVAVPVVIFVLWQLGSSHGWWDRRLFPAPSDAWSAAKRQFSDRSFATDIGYTIRRMLYGYFWGCLLGLAFAFVLGLSRTVRAALEPMFNGLYTVPKIALLPIFLIIFGFNERPVVINIAVTVFFFVWVPVQAAVMGVDRNFREAAESFGGNRWQMFRHVIFPATLPQIFVQLRVAASVAVLSVIGFEFVFAPESKGLGFQINTARLNFEPKLVYAGVVISAIIGILFTAAVRAIGRVVIRWQSEDNATSGG
jgi:sulfonate transport system permease protein